MAQEIDTFVYMMAAEKLGNMLFTIEQTLEFMTEYGVKPDEEVKKALKPLVDQMRKWIGDQVILSPTK